MKSYPRYKSTGLAWLPSVPEHWEMVKNRSFLYESKAVSSQGDAQLLSVSQYDGVTLFSEDRKERVSSLEGYKLVEKDDLVINIMLAWNGSSGVSAFKGVVSPAYAVFKFRGSANPRYVHYLFRSIPFRDYFKAYSTGVVDSRLRLYPQVLAQLWSPLPPPDEQTRIVQYLDEKTAAIDELVRAKERQIELLQELIERHTEDAMRIAPRTGIRLKRLVRQISDEITVEPKKEYHPLGVLNRGRGLFHKESLLGENLGDSTFFHVYPGDMIISGQFAWEGAVALLEETERGCIASHRYPLVRSASDDLKLEYLWAFFQTHYGDMVLNLHSHGAAGRNRPLNFDELLNEYLPFPSREKQETIAALVRKLSTMRHNVQRFKNLMNELRIRLVSDAVTGAVEV